MKKDSVGRVSYLDYRFATPLILESGVELEEVNIRYECYGELNESKDNAILVIHALTGNHHAAGYYEVDGEVSKKTRGWWENLIGPGKVLDTNKYFIISSNNLGGCSGTTGPNSLNPKTGKPYAMDFPVITIGDMVSAQLGLKKHLNIPKFHTIIGGSMGGLLALYWSIHYPEQVERVVAIATTACQNAQSIAFSEVARQSIMRDPNWNNGEYVFKVDDVKPNNGLSIARMLAHITYLSDDSMRKKFGRRLQRKNQRSGSNLDGGYKLILDSEFEVESYLSYQGAKFTDLFDANSYIYITKALNYADLSHGFESLKVAFQQSQSKYLIMSFSSDWLYPSYMGEELVQAVLQAGKEGSYAEIETDAGHDAFLLESNKITKLVNSFLNH